MASRNFTNLADHLARARINLATGTFKAVIVASIPSEANLDAWDFLNDVSIEIAAGGGYSAGGFAVTPTLGAVDAANNRVPVTYAAATPTYAASTITGVGCIVYQVEGTAAASPLLHFIDWNGTITSTNGNFQANFLTPLYIQG